MIVLFPISKSLAFTEENMNNSKLPLDARAKGPGNDNKQPCSIQCIPLSESALFSRVGDTTGDYVETVNASDNPTIWLGLSPLSLKFNLKEIGTATFTGNWKFYVDYCEPGFINSYKPYLGV